MNAPSYTSMLADYPLTASLDYDGAIRRAIADELAASPYLPGVGWVDPGDGACAPSGAIVIHPEWADGDHHASWPGIVLRDAFGTLAPTQNAPDDDERTLWPSEDESPDAPARVVMRCYGEYQVNLPIMVEANDRPMRARLINAVTQTLLGHTNVDACAEDRYGLLLSAGSYFYDAPIKVRPYQAQRFDAALTQQQRVRRFGLVVQCSIDVAYPVVLPTIQQPIQTAPLDESGYLNVEV